MIATVALLLSVAAAETPSAGDPEAPVAVVASAIRERGYACDRPRSLERDAEFGHPDRAAWIVTCAEGRYRVIFEGDTGPAVQPVD